MDKIWKTVFKSSGKLKVKCFENSDFCVDQVVEGLDGREVNFGDASFAICPYGRVYFADFVPNLQTCEKISQNRERIWIPCFR